MAAESVKKIKYALATFFILFNCIHMLNAVAQALPRAYIYKSYLPEWLKLSLEKIGHEQQWRMFAPIPANEDRRLLAKIRFASGEVYPVYIPALPSEPSLFEAGNLNVFQMWAGAVERKDAKYLPNEALKFVTSQARLNLKSHGPVAGVALLGEYKPITPIDISLLNQKDMSPPPERLEHLVGW